jgi:hypothetical protein
MPTEANSPIGANVLGRFLMAAFEVITYGRFWVIAEESSHCHNNRDQPRVMPGLPVTNFLIIC